MKTNPNEPINPCEVGYKEYNIKQERQVTEHTAMVNGLTKREHFASLALQGLLAKYTLKTPEDQVIISKAAIELADTFINELNK